MSLNLTNQFPSITPDKAYLDFGATALMPQSVIDAMHTFETDYRANVHRGLHEASERASEAYEQARKTVATFLNVEPSEIVFTSGTTASLNLAARLLFESPNIKLDKPIVAHQHEHHANFIPWQQLSKRHGKTFEVIDLHERAPEQASILAFSHVSNVTGAVLDLTKRNADYTIVDLAQSVSHLPIDLSHGDIDFAAFSGHKLYGSTGIGVLYVNKRLHSMLEPTIWGGGMIESVTTTESTWAQMPAMLEPGTPPIAQAIGLAEAIQFVQNVGFETTQTHEQEIITYGLEQLQAIPELSIIGPTDRVGSLTFTINGIHAHDVAQVLADRGVAVRAGHHCAMPLHDKLGISASVRASIGIPTTKEDIDQLVEGVQAAIKLFKT